MKWLLSFTTAIILLFACSSPSGNSQEQSQDSNEKANTAMADDGKGIGEIKQVDLNDPLNEAWVEKGKEVYELKCAACHKLTDQRVVGPGWAGITKKRKPEWIMNMTLNIEVMLEKDPAARELLKECLVRMPNQNLSQQDARNVLEFMFHNDLAIE